MKRIILATILMAGVLGALQITALGGGNHQAWIDEGEAFLNGFSWHTGVLINEGISLGMSPLSISAESGVIYQYEKYNDMFYYSDTGGAVYDSASMYWRYDNLIIPVLLKGSVDIKSLLNLSVGTGPSIVYPLSGRIWYEPEIGGVPSPGKLNRDEMDTYLTWQVKGEAGVKILPRMWITATVTGQYKIADLSPEAFVDKRSYFASLGLAFKTKKAD